MIRLGSPSSPPKMVPPTQGQEGARQLKSWELIPPSKGWMSEGDDVEGKEASEEVPERVGDAKWIEEEVVDADEDYLQYSAELQRHPDYSPFHSSRAYAQRPSDDTQFPSSDAHSQPSFDLSGIWPPPVGSSQ
ncbi:hypothetical protein PIB30_062355 [Stylosanthes scabra]|uniref:Uncharacterized protein n=1 Tax=Stylosanthes scabra TaxID=79078 RepID=A0ABU6YJA3_9FABA|nr:hypothetical protein [Stylosanthes scabra]